jgi:hypothetical protein
MAVVMNHCPFIPSWAWNTHLLSLCVLPHRNGVGKSTLLHVLGSRLLVGFPAWLSCLHVEQEVAGSDSTTAVQAVLAADVKGAQLQRWGWGVCEGCRRRAEDG